MRIGVNSGEIVTGNMGSATDELCMMGDSVNLAARLEEAAKQYGIYVHFTEYTLELLDHQEEFLFVKLIQLELSGKRTCHNL